MQENKKERLHQLRRAQREAQFEKAWSASTSEYARTREITEFIRNHGNGRGGLLPLPSTELAELIKLLSKEFYLGKETEQFEKGNSLVERYLVSHGHDLSQFHDWCKESGIASDGQFLGLLRDVWGTLKDRQKEIDNSL